MEQRTVVEAALQAMAASGWSLSSVGADTWRLARNGRRAFATLGRHWLCLCQPIGSPTGQGDGRNQVHLLARSQNIFMAKYSLDSARQLVLQVEIPRDGLDRAYCERAIHAVVTYARRHDVAEVLPSRAPAAGPHHFSGAELRPADESELVNTDTLVLYFQSTSHLGWVLKDRAALNSWLVLYKGRERPFEGRLLFCGSWATFSLRFQLEGSPAQRQTAVPPPPLLDHCLRLNHALFWAKMGLAGDQVVLTLDLPLEAFDLRRCRWACQTLATYADEHASDVQVLASLNEDHGLQRHLRAARDDSG